MSYDGHEVIGGATYPDTCFSMIRNTVIYDHDVSLGHGADVYVCYDDDFFVANATGAGTVPPGGLNLRILPTALADFAQFEVRTDLPDLNAPTMTVSVKSHVDGQPRTMLLDNLPSGEDQAEYGFNAPIGLDTDPNTHREGVYLCSIPGPKPTAYEIKIQFAEAEGIPTIIGVPLEFPPATLVLNTNVDIWPDIEASLVNLLNTNKSDAWYHDAAAKHLYVKTTSVVLGLNGPDLDGTRNVIEVN